MVSLRKVTFRMLKMMTMVTMMKMMTMVAGEKEAVWIHHDRRPSVEMPRRGLLNEGTSRDGDRDNERPLDS